MMDQAPKQNDQIFSDGLYNKLDKLYQRAERRRLDGKKPTPVQIRKIVHKPKRDRPGQPRKYKKMFAITPMQSAMVIDEITQAMMPETNDINHFVGVK